MTLLKEPALHFILIGFVIFIASSLFQKQKESTETIVIDSSLRDALSAKWDTSNAGDKQKLKFEELKQEEIDQYINNEILYREGIKRGLDKDDRIIKTRVQSKMELLIDRNDEYEPVGEDIIKNYYTKNISNYRIDKKISFKTLFFSKAVRDNAGTDSIETLKKIKTARAGQLSELLKTGDRPAEGHPLQMKDARKFLIQFKFGKQIADTLDKIKKTGWTGPVETDKGYWLIYVEKIIPAGAIPLSKVKARIKIELREKQKKERIQKFLNRIRHKYKIVVD
jgi:parvulin-like peptidyl-prolyl isomerase